MREHVTVLLEDGVDFFQVVLGGMPHSDFLVNTKIGSNFGSYPGLRGPHIGDSSMCNVSVRVQPLLSARARKAFSKSGNVGTSAMLTARTPSGLRAWATLFKVASRNPPSHDSRVG